MRLKLQLVMCSDDGQEEGRVPAGCG